MSTIGNQMQPRMLEPALLDQEPSCNAFLEEVHLGLQQSPKTLPCKYFYDERGSRLFDRICELDEYSHKYTVAGFAQSAAKAGLTLRKEWTDDRRRFAVLHFAIVE